MGQIFNHNTGKALNKTNSSGTNLSYITTSNLYWGSFELDTLKQMYFTESEIEKCTVRHGDLLVCEGGDIGRAAIWNYDYEIRIQNHIHKLRPFLGVNVKLYFYVFWLYKFSGRISGKGIGIQGLSSNQLHNIIIPLPPLQEQNHIVSKINKLLNIVDTIEINKTDLQSTVQQAKSKILDLAIQGKLVPQDPNDEPASVLLERIRAEKEELIKQGKIKRDKKESVIFKSEDNSYYEKMPTGEVKCIDDELPFDIPEGWEWCNLCDLVSVLNGDRGQNYPAKSKLQKWGIPFVSASNIVDGVVSGDRSDMFYLSDEQFDALNAGKLISGDIVYCIRGSLGKCGIFHDEKGAIASSLVIVRPYMKTQELLSYIFLYLNSNLAKREINKYDNGSAQPNLAAKDFMRFMVPLPPYCEMSSILIRVNKLNNQIANIEASLR